MTVVLVVIDVCEKIWVDCVLVVEVAVIGEVFAEVVEETEVVVKGLVALSAGVDVAGMVETSAVPNNAVKL